MIKIPPLDNWIKRTTPINLSEKINFRLFTLSVVLFCTTAIYLYLISLIKQNYMPVWSDEFLYYINAKSFYLTSSLKAAFTLAGTGSPIFGADPHGFAYPLFNGLIAKVVGWHNVNFIYTNFCIIFLSVMLYWQQKFLTLNQKISITILFLLFPFLPFYSITHMQEIIHVFFAVILSILIYKIYHTEDNRFYIFSYIITLVIAGFFRSLWLYWLIGLLPLSKTKKEFSKYLLIFMLGIVGTVIIQNLFCEKAIYYFYDLMVLIKQYEFITALKSLLGHFYSNLKNYFIYYDSSMVIYLFIKYVLLFLVLYFIYRFFTKFKNNKMYMALALIGGINFLLVFSLYDTFAWREIRTLSPLFYFFLIFLVLDSKILTRILICLTVLPFLVSISLSKQVIMLKNETLLSTPEKVNAFNEIKFLSTGKKDFLILVDFPLKDYSQDLFDWPLTNQNHGLIRYIIEYTNFYDIKNPNIDFILSPAATTDTYTGYKQIISNEYYTLYQNRNTLAIH